MEKVGYIQLNLIKIKLFHRFEPTTKSMTASALLQIVDLLLKMEESLKDYHDNPSFFGILFSKYLKTYTLILLHPIILFP